MFPFTSYSQSERCKVKLARFQAQCRNSNVVPKCGHMLNKFGLSVKSPRKFNSETFLDKTTTCRIEDKERERKKVKKNGGTGKDNRLNKVGLSWAKLKLS